MTDESQTAQYSSAVIEKLSQHTTKHWPNFDASA